MAASRCVVASAIWLCAVATECHSTAAKMASAPTGIIHQHFLNSMSAAAGLLMQAMMTPARVSPTTM